ncbi:LacI family DNA-binding transcriptional regulator [Massilia sp. HP4]|uniref:LacI family DNA-binding transcriptional regulator n=1 Tax=Massilia sp. HP4 TaxID=2562316 RepID=UPI0010C0EDF4|nr:LacI family DNA-binding transcriptional regulator [Massilia sp. HP4]
MEKTGRSRGRGTGRATLEQVAGMAGVSIMTASRALSQPQMVSEVTRVKVERAVAELGYVPNRAARALASSQSHVIVVLVPSFSNAVFTAVLEGIHDAVAPGQYQLLIGNTYYSQAEEEKLLRTYLQSSPDGILFSSQAHSPAVVKMLEASQVPAVSMMDLSDAPGDLSVGFSQFEAGMEMTRHLLKKGYRRIGFMGAQLDERTLRRADGYRAAMAEAGLADPGLEMMVPERSTIALGAELMGQMMARMPDCDAVFCCNDDLAHGAVYHCQRHGVQIPQDIAVCGFNDLPASAFMMPSLTTIDTPRYQIGFEAAGLLLQVIKGQEPERKRIDLGFTLRARESA